MLMAVQTRTNPTVSTTPVTLIGLLFLALGIGAFTVLVSNIVNVLNLRAPDEIFGTTLMRFLDVYGIIVPLILVGIGYALIRIGLGVLNRDITAAAWGRQLLLWFVIASVVVAVQAISQGLGNNTDAFPGLATGILTLLAGGVFMLGYWWLGNNMFV